MVAIAYYQIYGIPLIAYLGIVTLASVVFTALIPVLNSRGISKIPMRWHFHAAKVSIALASLHGVLGILAYF